MNIAISNIAWNPSEDEAVLDLLENMSISGLEIAPTKIWADPLTATDKQLDTYTHEMRKRNLQVVAMQSLLFDHPELEIFISEKNRQETLEYVEHIIRIGRKIGAHVLVFGSPKNRAIPPTLASSKAKAIAQDFFFRLGNIAQKYGIVIGIEPNPEKYGTNFLTTSSEVIAFVRDLDHPGIRVHLDTGAMYINKEDYPSVIQQALPYLAHFHISHDNLADITIPGIDHARIAHSLQKGGYNKWVSIEMRNEKEYNLKRVKNALELVKRYYL